MWSSRNGHCKSIEILVASGAITTLKDNLGRTAFDLAKNEDTRIALSSKTAPLRKWLVEMGYGLLADELLRNPAAVIVLTGLQKKFNSLGSSEEGQ
jgi:hypothetical protein